MSSDTRDDSTLEESGVKPVPGDGKLTTTAEGLRVDGGDGSDSEALFAAPDADPPSVEVDGSAADGTDGSAGDPSSHVATSSEPVDPVDEGTGDPADEETVAIESVDVASHAEDAESSHAEDSESAPASTVGADGAPAERAWYVLRVQSGREDTCANALRKKVVLAKMDHLIEEIAVPKRKLTEIKEGKRRVRAEKLFPGYILIHMCLDDDLWYLIRDTSGIGDFVGSHQKPTAMPAAEVKKIMDMLEEKEDEAPEVKIDLLKNDMVKIKEGPFEDFDGVVEEVHPTKGTVRVMVTIFGRPTPVDLEYWQVEKL